MKTIGLIGGMSWESTVLYYQTLNRTVQRRLGGSHSCQCLLYSFDFEEIARLQHEGRWDVLAMRMVDAAKRLEAGGADLLLICANTMHKVADEVHRSVGIPLVHIVDAAAERIQERSLSTLGLLATRYAMEEGFLRDRYRERFGIETLIPDEAERADIHRIIYEELVRGITTEASKRRFIEIIARLVERGAQGIIAGCTEIEILIQQADIAVELFATAKLHAEKAVELALATDDDSPTRQGTPWIK